MKPEQLVLFERYADAVAADRYRVTSIKFDEINGTKKSLILDKKDGVSKGFTREEVAGHMKEMLSLLRRGENIYYTPLSQNKHHVLVDDVSDFYELKRDGFGLSAVIESSPGNFQVIITVPKLGVPEDRQIGNMLSNYLNKRYGDQRFFGCIHPHRAPGFKNFKLKYKDKQGDFPIVRLVEAEGDECPKALELARRWYKKIKDDERSNKDKAPSNNRPSEIEIQRPTDEAAAQALEAYMAHYYHISGLLARLAVADDYSRYDSMIALRMRATGHSKSAIAYAISVMSPRVRMEYSRKPIVAGRNWNDYGRRTAEFAFSPGGERQLERLQAYISEWRQWEREYVEARLAKATSS
jgi:hypothetical protein